MPSTYELELALEQQAQQRERALRHASLVRAAHGVTLDQPTWQRAAALVAVLATRLIAPFAAPAAGRDDTHPLPLVHPAQPSAATTDDQRAA